MHDPECRQGKGRAFVRRPSSPAAQVLRSSVRQAQVLEALGCPRDLCMAERKVGRAPTNAQKWDLPDTVSAPSGKGLPRWTIKKGANQQPRNSGIDYLPKHVPQLFVIRISLLLGRYQRVVVLFFLGSAICCSVYDRIPMGLGAGLTYSWFLFKKQCKLWNPLVCTVPQSICLRGCSVEAGGSPTEAL